MKNKVSLIFSIIGIMWLTIGTVHMIVNKNINGMTFCLVPNIAIILNTIEEFKIR